MRIYRFRVLIDDPSEAFRDVEIGSEQNFLEFHRAIKEAFGFSGDEMASFYVSDEEWGKGPEIPLADLGFGEDGDTPPALMEEVYISDHMRSMRQRYLYVYDFLHLWVFMVELIGAYDPEEGTTYPRVVMAMGTPPGEHSKDLDLGPVEEDEEGHTSEFDEDDYDEEDPLSGSSNIDDLGDEYL